MTIPRTIDDITPEWLSDALGRSVTSVDDRAHRRRRRVSSASCSALQMDGDGEPSTVIAKLAAPTDEGRFVATVLNMYGREVGFYNELSPRTTIAHPECYFAAHDPVTQDSVLLLEDVSVARSRRRSDRRAARSPRRGPRSARSRGCTRASGTIASLPTSSFLLQLCRRSVSRPRSAMAYDIAWPRVQELFGDMIDDRVREFGDALLGADPGAVRASCATARSCCRTPTGGSTTSSSPTTTT